MPSFDYDNSPHIAENLDLWKYNDYKEKPWRIIDECRLITPYDNDIQEVVRLYHIDPTVRAELQKYCDIFIKYRNNVINDWKKTSEYAPYEKANKFVDELRRLRNNEKITGHFWVEFDGEIIDPDFDEYETVRRLNNLSDKKAYQPLPQYRNEMINKYIMPITTAIEQSKMTNDEFLKMIQRTTDGEMFVVDNCPINCIVSVMMLEKVQEGTEYTHENLKIQYGNFGWMDKNGNPFYEYEDDRTFDAFNDNNDYAFRNAIKHLRRIVEKRNSGKPLNKAEKSSLIAMGINPMDFNGHNGLFGKDYSVDGGKNLNKKSRMGIAFDKTTGINKNVSMSQLAEFNRKEKLIEHLRNMKSVKDTREKLKSLDYNTRIQAQKLLLK
tara:strand:- start:2549 stop:3691 length:1143 start_codon:yes stop_codon:yes gene_type:complete